MTTDYICARNNMTRIMIGGYDGAMGESDDGEFTVYTAMAAGAAKPTKFDISPPRQRGAPIEASPPPPASSFSNGELDYGPGFVQRLRARFSQLADTGTNTVEVSPHIRCKRFPSTGDVFAARSKDQAPATPMTQSTIEKRHDFPQFVTPLPPKAATAKSIQQRSLQSDAKTFSTVIACGFSPPEAGADPNTVPAIGTQSANNLGSESCFDLSNSPENGTRSRPATLASTTEVWTRKADAGVPTTTATKVKSVSARVAEYWQNSMTRKWQTSAGVDERAPTTTTTRFSALREKFEQISRADPKNVNQCGGGARKWGRSRSTHFDEISPRQDSYDSCQNTNQSFATNSLKRQHGDTKYKEAQIRPASSPPADPQPAQLMKASFAYVVSAEESFSAETRAALRHTGDNSPPPEEPLPSMRSPASTPAKETKMIKLNITQNVSSKRPQISLASQRQPDKNSSCVGLSEMRNFVDRFNDQRRRRESTNILPVQPRSPPTTKAPEYRAYLRTHVEPGSSTIAPNNCAKREPETANTTLANRNEICVNLSAEKADTKAGKREPPAELQSTEISAQCGINLLTSLHNEPVSQQPAQNVNSDTTVSKLPEAEVVNKKKMPLKPKETTVAPVTNAEAAITTTVVQTGEKARLPETSLNKFISDNNNDSGNISRVKNLMNQRHSFSSVYFEQQRAINDDEFSLGTATSKSIGESRNSSESEEPKCHGTFEANEAIAVQAKELTASYDFVVDDGKCVAVSNLYPAENQPLDLLAYDREGELPYCALEIQRNESANNSSLFNDKTRGEEAKSAVTGAADEQNTSAEYNLIVDTNDKVENNESKENKEDDNVACDKNNNFFNAEICSNSESVNLIDESCKNDNIKEDKDQKPANDFVEICDNMEHKKTQNNEENKSCGEIVAVKTKSIETVTIDCFNNNIDDEGEDDEDLRAWCADDPFAAALANARGGDSGVFDDVDFERVSSPPSAAHTAIGKYSMLAADGSPVRHSLLSLVMDEDIPDLLEAMAEEHNFVFEDYWTMAASTSSIILSPISDENSNGAGGRNRKRRNANTHISFEEKPPLVFAYLDEASAVAERDNGWPAAQTISFDDYQRIVQRAEDALNQQQAELDVWQSHLQTSCDDSKNPSVLSNSLSESISRMTMNASNEGSNPFCDVTVAELASAVNNHAVFSPTKALLPA